MKIEGRNAVLELLKTDKTIDKILVMNGMRDNESRGVINAIRQKGCKFQFVEKAIMDKETETRRHQGFIAFVSDYVYADFDEIIKKLEDEVEITNERLEDAVKIETIKFLQGYREALLTSILIIKDGLKD